MLYIFITFCLLHQLYLIIYKFAIDLCAAFYIKTNWMMSSFHTLKENFGFCPSHFLFRSWLVWYWYAEKNYWWERASSIINFNVFDTESELKIIFTSDWTMILIAKKELALYLYVLVLEHVFDSNIFNQIISK